VAAVRGVVLRDSKEGGQECEEVHHQLQHQLAAILLLLPPPHRLNTVQHLASSEAAPGTV
jgi:hypothetical protein